MQITTLSFERSPIESSFSFSSCLSSLYHGSSQWNTFQCDQTNWLPSQSEKKQKALYSLHPLWISQNMCLPCWIIIQSCYFDYKINKPYARSHGMICLPCSVHLRCVQRIMGFFILITHKSMRLENLYHMVASNQFLTTMSGGGGRGVQLACPGLTLCQSKTLLYSHSLLW